MVAPVEVVVVLVVGVLDVRVLDVVFLPVFVVARGEVDLGLVVTGALAGGEGLMVLNEDV